MGNLIFEDHESDNLQVRNDVKKRFLFKKKKRGVGDEREKQKIQEKQDEERLTNCA